MKPAIETMDWAARGLTLHAYCRRSRVFEWNWHYHPEIELTLITKGSGTCLVGDTSAAYAKMDLVLLGPNLPHTWFSNKTGRTGSSNEAIVVQFRKDAIPDALLALPEFRGIRDLLLEAHRGLRFDESTADTVSCILRRLPHLEGMEGWLALVGVLQELSVSNGKVLASDAYRNKRAGKLERRLDRILNHIGAACTETLTLEDVAASAGMTPSSFSRFFRKMTGRTFVEYRNGCRIERAIRLLDETDRSVVDIAYASGFQSLPSFNRYFRERIGQAPRDYRKLRNPPIIQPPGSKNSVALSIKEHK